MAVNGVFNINQLAAEITRQLELYAKQTDATVQRIAEKVAKDGVKMLRTAGTFKDITGDYRTGWRAKKVKGKWVVHNETDYRLTHLLEKGHVIKNGTGRKYGNTRVFEHIKPTEKKMVEEFEIDLRRGLS